MPILNGCSSKIVNNMTNSTKSTKTVKSSKTLKFVKSNKPCAARIENFSGNARLRSDTSCHEAQVIFKKKLEIAAQLKARGSRFSAQYLARHRTLSELQMMFVTF